MIHQTVTRVGVRSGHRVTNVCVRGSVLGYLAGRCIGGELRDGVGSRSSGGARGFVGALRIAVAGSGPQQLTRINACRGVGVAGGRTNINPRDRVCGRVCGAGPLPHNAGRCAVEIRQRRFDLRPDLCGWWCQGHRPGLVDVADVDRHRYGVVDRLVGVAGRVFVVADRHHHAVNLFGLIVEGCFGFELPRRRVDHKRGLVGSGELIHQTVTRVGVRSGHRVTNVCVRGSVLGYLAGRCIGGELRFFVDVADVDRHRYGVVCCGFVCGGHHHAVNLFGLIVEGCFGFELPRRRVDHKRGLVG